MKIFYFSTALSDEIYNEIVKNSKVFKPTFSGVGFDRNVAIGLSNYAEVKGISFYPIPSYPKYNKIIQKKNKFSKKNFDCIVPEIFNLPIIKEFSYYYQVLNYVKKNYSFKEENIIIVSGLYRCLLRPARYLKRKYKLKVYAIVPDLPELMITYRKDYSSFRKFLNEIDVKKSQKYRDCVDGFIFLSKYMNIPVNKLNKPVIVVDGLTDIASFPEIYNKRKEKIILYAGKVSSTFGVDKLVNAFIKANLDNNIKLFICGDGDYSHDLEQIAKKNSSIEYLGILSHKEVLELEVQASLLVDPRPSDMEIVKMSFPSKIIEYMASGTPVLTTNLPCFSDEYRKYQFRIDDESIEGIAKALTKIFKISPNELKKRGEEAKKFIIENKTMQKQCEKIIEFISRLEENE